MSTAPDGNLVHVNVPPAMTDADRSSRCYPNATWTATAIPDDPFAGLQNALDELRAAKHAAHRPDTVLVPRRSWLWMMSAWGRRWLVESRTGVKIHRRAKAARRDARARVAAGEAVTVARIDRKGREHRKGTRWLARP